MPEGELQSVHSKKETDMHKYVILNGNRNGAVRTWPLNLLDSIVGLDRKRSLYICSPTRYAKCANE